MKVRTSSTRTTWATVEYVVYVGHPKAGALCYFAKNILADGDKLSSYQFLHSGTLGMDGVE